MVNKNIVTLGAVSVVSLAVGTASGWFLAKKKLGAEFDRRLDAEIASTAAFYKNLSKPNPEFLAEQLLDEEDLQPKSQYDTTSREVPQEILERVAASMAKAEQEVSEEAEPMGPHNAFENPAPAWVQADEEMERRNGVPYIISKEEFYTNELELEEGHLTYYEGDDTLADSRDEPITDQYAAVGELSLERFGHGSEDPNIVYVCNEQMGMIFEICRSNKSFAEDVLGFRHEESPRRFRTREAWDG